MTLPEALIEEMIEALFEASDSDHDGQISFDEFVVVFSRYPELLERITQASAVW